MHGRTFIGLAALFLALALPALPARADGPYTLLGAFPGGKTGSVPVPVPDLSKLDTFEAWQGKRNAIVNAFAGDPATAGGFMTAIWETHRSVPMISYHPAGTNAARAAGTMDQADTRPLARATARFVSGPDGDLGTGDDRRLYLRYAWEPNVRNQTHSPCNNIGSGTGDDYIRAWRRAHRIFAEHGLDSSTVQWIYSVGSEDQCAEGSIESTYPGDDFVDWTGVDVYSYCGGVLSTPLAATVRKLRAVAPEKPVGVNEVGVTSLVGPHAKNYLINEYWSAVASYDLRMSVWFNANLGSDPGCGVVSQPWEIFSRTYGDETVSGETGEFRGYSAYRLRVGEPRVIGSDPNHPRLISNRMFRGR